MKNPKPKAGTINEFSRFVRVDSIPNGGAHFEIEAKPEERIALAKRLNLLTLDQLQADLRLNCLTGDELYRLEGTIKTYYAQACVVTELAVEGKLEEDFSYLFTSRDDYDLDEEREETPEPLEDGGIDLGEIMAQHLSLNLPAFPRADDAQIEAATQKIERAGKVTLNLASISAETTPITPPKNNPFAKLTTLRKQ